MEIPLQPMSHPTPAVLTTRHSTQTFTNPEYFRPRTEETATSPLLSPLSDYNRYIPYRPQTAPSQPTSRSYPPIPYQSTQYAPKPPTHRSRPSETSINSSEWHHLDNRQIIRTFTSLGKEVERFSQPFATEEEYNHEDLESGITKLGLYHNLFRRRYEPLDLVQALAKPEARKKFVEGIIWAALTEWVFRTPVESDLRRDSVSSYQPSSRSTLDQYLSTQISAVQEPIQQLWRLISLFPQAPELRGGASTELDLRSVFILARDKAVLLYSQPVPFQISSFPPDNTRSSTSSGQHKEAKIETCSNYTEASTAAFYPPKPSSPNPSSSPSSSSPLNPPSTPSSPLVTRPKYSQRDSGFFSIPEDAYHGAEWTVSPGLYKPTQDGYISIVPPIRWPSIILDEVEEVWEDVVTHNWPPRMSLQQPKRGSVEIEMERGFWGG
ncbi:hypothetical protein BZA77DRAFT_318647, partial [Pyronema omphalodes]